MIVREEMAKRLGQDAPMSLRLLAAAVLVFENDDRGKEFFRTHARVIDTDLDDLFVTLDHIDMSWRGLKGADSDLTWAEDLMVDALQNRTELDRKKTLHAPDRMNFVDNTVEVRELAANSRFPEILAKVHSKKALPVIIGLIQENPQPVDVRGAVRALGSN